MLAGFLLGFAIIAGIFGLEWVIKALIILLFSLFKEIRVLNETIKQHIR